MTALSARHESDAAAGLWTAGYDGVVVATLDRPPANALNRALLLAMTALFRDRGQGDPAPIVITGAGARFFCAGGDIKEADGAAADPVEDRMRGFHNLLVAMERYPAPVIAAVNGDCVGGGVEYALFADVVLAAPHARFGFPEIRHGLLPADKGIQRLVRLIGTRPARDLLLMPSRRHGGALSTRLSSPIDWWRRRSAGPGRPAVELLCSMRRLSRP